MYTFYRGFTKISESYSSKDLECIAQVISDKPIYNHFYFIRIPRSLLRGEGRQSRIALNQGLCSQQDNKAEGQGTGSVSEFQNNQQSVR